MAVSDEPISRPLSFVTVTDPKDIKNRHLQHRIRRHAGLNSTRKRPKKSHPTTWKFELKTVTLGTGATAAPEDEGLQVDSAYHSASSNSVSAGPHTPQNNDRGQLQTRRIPERWLLPDPHAVMDPFQGSALPADERSRLLFDFFIHFKSQTTYPFAPLCFSFALWDEAVISLILASASSLYKKQIGSQDVDAESSKYLAVGLRSVNCRLRDPVDSTSDGVMCALVALVCIGLFEGKFSGWRMHMQGLKEIVGLRGGPKSLASSDYLQLALLLIDINGGLALDAKPFFRIPRYVPSSAGTEHFSPVLGSSLSILRSFSKGDLDHTCDALVSVAQLSDYINENAFQPGFFTNDSVRSTRFFPVLSEVLHLARPGQESHHSETPLPEAIRLTLLLYVALLKERFCIAPDCIETRSSVLSQHLSIDSITHGDSRLLPIWLWIHATLAISMNSKERGWVIVRISNLMHQMAISSWYDAAEKIRGISWVDQLGNDSLAILGLEIRKHEVLDPQTALIWGSYDLESF